MLLPAAPWPGQTDRLLLASPRVPPTRKAPQSQRGLLRSLSLVQRGRPATHPSSSSLATYIVQGAFLTSVSPCQWALGRVWLASCFAISGKTGESSSLQPLVSPRTPARKESGEGAHAGGPVWLMLLSPGPSWSSFSPLWLSLPVHTLSPHPDCLSPEKLSAMESVPATLLKWLRASFTALHV